ncbi:hypothetical protein MTO96_050009 [Rhipicephalus appendiculatus]
MNALPRAYRKTRRRQDGTQLMPEGGLLKVKKVQQLEAEIPVLESQGETATIERMITNVVVRSGDNEGPQGSRASPEETQVAGKKDTNAPEEFREKGQAEATPQIAEEGAGGIVERHCERSRFVQGHADTRERIHASKLRLCYTKVESVSVLLEQGGALSDAEYEPRPAAPYDADICPFSDSSSRAGGRYHGRVPENFSKSGVPFGGQPTSMEQHNVVSEEIFILESSHPHKSAEAEARMLLEWEQCRVECASVCYLGRVVGSTCHALDPERLTGVRGLSSPTTEMELRDFHGSCGHYLSYGPNYANVARLPSGLTGGRVPNRIPWCAWADGASQRHGATLSEAAPEIRADPEMPYWLFVDVSVATSEVFVDVSVATSPSQRAESDAEASIAFARHGFSPTQTREPLSVSWNPRVFNLWLFYAQVTVVSDHHPLSFPTHARCRGHLIVARLMAAVLRGADETLED